MLEPSCGEAAFLLQAARRLRQLGATGGLSDQLHGAELHGASAEAARAALRAAGEAARIEVGDFLALEPSATYAAVVGNPPYVRYQAFTGDSRAAARRAALRAGVRLSALWESGDVSRTTAFELLKLARIEPEQKRVPGSQRPVAFL